MKLQGGEKGSIFITKTDKFMPHEVTNNTEI